MDTYTTDQLRHVEAQGPQAGEDFYRLQVRGYAWTKHLNITPGQLAAIIATLETTPAQEGPTT